MPPSPAVWDAAEEIHFSPKALRKQKQDLHYYGEGEIVKQAHKTIRSYFRDAFPVDCCLESGGKSAQELLGKPQLRLSSSGS